VACLGRETTVQSVQEQDPGRRMLAPMLRSVCFVLLLIVVIALLACLAVPVLGVYRLMEP
jgi:hypothetical protein